MSQLCPFAALEVTEENWLKPNCTSPSRVLRKPEGAHHTSRRTERVQPGMCSGAQ